MLNLSVENLLHSNLFNFCIMIAILAWIFKKAKVSEAIESNRQKIEDTVNSSIQEKDRSIEEFKAVEKTVQNTVLEIEAIVETAKTTLKTLETKIAQDTEVQVKNIEKNVTKVIESETSKLSSRLSRGVSNASVALAQSHVVKMLNENADLHYKFINDSIDELDRVEI